MLFTSAADMSISQKKCVHTANYITAEKNDLNDYFEMLRQKLARQVNDM